jgi:hypothetical protein
LGEGEWGYSNRLTRNSTGNAKWTDYTGMNLIHPAHAVRGYSTMHIKAMWLAAVVRDNNKIGECGGIFVDRAA